MVRLGREEKTLVSFRMGSTTPLGHTVRYTACLGDLTPRRRLWARKMEEPCWHWPQTSPSPHNKVQLSPFLDRLRSTGWKKNPEYASAATLFFGAWVPGKGSVCVHRRRRRAGGWFFARGKFATLDETANERAPSPWRRDWGTIAWFGLWRSLLLSHSPPDCRNGERADGHPSCWWRQKRQSWYGTNEKNWNNINKKTVIVPMSAVVWFKSKCVLDSSCSRDTQDKGC